MASRAPVYVARDKNAFSRLLEPLVTVWADGESLRASCQMLAWKYLPLASGRSRTRARGVGGMGLPPVSGDYVHPPDLIVHAFGRPF